jgi:hypothetical protein
LVDLLIIGLFNNAVLFEEVIEASNEVETSRMVLRDMEGGCLGLYQYNHQRNGPNSAEIRTGYLSVMACKFSALPLHQSAFIWRCWRCRMLSLSQSILQNSKASQNVGLLLKWFSMRTLVIVLDGSQALRMCGWNRPSIVSIV